jgi:hypothetical protein
MICNESFDARCFRSQTGERKKEKSDRQREEEDEEEEPAV